MEESPSPDPSTFPKLRPIESRWVEYQGQPCLYLKDPLGLGKGNILVPRAVAPLLALCDGTRDPEALRAAFLLHTGAALTTSQIQNLLTQLDDALLLENGLFRQALDKATADYRSGEFRSPSHAGLVYPDRADELNAALAGYYDRLPEDQPPPLSGDLVGMVCPHIDYTRGHETYARLWRRAAPKLRDLETVVIFGTDHSGGLGKMTPTWQNYATPFGVLPTDRETVRSVADALGREHAFAEEFHHANEHSIELAAVWLQHSLGRRACPIVPILCGSFHHFVMGEEDPAKDDAIADLLESLRNAVAGRKTLVIAAADLAHVGPAFGDAAPMDTARRARLAADDDASIRAICDGDAEGFFDMSRRERDARRICGLPPIYLALRYLREARGESLGYDQCPADAADTSLVSIAGILLYEDDGLCDD